MNMAVKPLHIVLNKQMYLQEESFQTIEEESMPYLNYKKQYAY